MLKVPSQPFSSFQITPFSPKNDPACFEVAQENIFNQVPRLNQLEKMLQEVRREVEENRKKHTHDLEKIIKRITIICSLLNKK